MRRAGPPPPAGADSAAAISAVVVTFANGALLGQCLQALDQAGVGEIIVVDNNAAGPEAEAVVQACEAWGARRLGGHGNIGFGAGCNRGAAAAGGEMLLFVNPDLTIARDAPAALAAALAEAPGPSIVGGRIIGLDGREQRGGRRAVYTPWNVLGGLLRTKALGRLHAAFAPPDAHDAPLPAGPVVVGAVSGALFAMRRSDFHALGGFDEGYFLHVEDVDLCRRAGLAGGRVLFVPDAEGVHVGGASSADWVGVQRLKARSFARYFRKFAHSPWERAAAALIAPLLFPALVAQAAIRRWSKRHGRAS